MSIKIFKWFQRREGSIRGAKERKVWNIIQSVVLGIWNAAKMVWIGWMIRRSSNPLSIPVLDSTFYNIDLSIDISETISPSLSR